MAPTSSPDHVARLDTQALLDAAARAGTPVSERMLETFRYKGLIPRPQRTGYRGRAPVWIYPADADAQLVRLLRWRSRTKDVGVLKVLLWLDGFTIPLEDVRAALLGHLRQMNRAIEQAITSQAHKLGCDPADDEGRAAAVEELARVMAAKRGATPIPRRVRVRAADRSHTLAMLMRAIGLGESVQATPEEGEAAERVLGIGPNGRRYSPDGASPWLTGPAEEIFGAAGIVGIPGMLETLENSSDDSIRDSRQIVNALFRHLPLAVRMMDAVVGQDNAVGLDALEQVTEDPESIMWLLPAVIAMLGAGWEDNLATITQSLQQFPELAERAKALLDTPKRTFRGLMSSSSSALG